MPRLRSASLHFVWYERGAKKIMVGNQKESHFKIGGVPQIVLMRCAQIAFCDEIILLRLRLRSWMKSGMSPSTVFDALVSGGHPLSTCRVDSAGSA